jgi:hypothetical protein
MQNSPAKKPEPIAPAKAFTLLLEAACEEFEVLQLLIRNEIQVTFSQPGNAPTDNRIMFRRARAGACIQMALAKSFVANVIRAHRICEDGAQYLTVDRDERRRFLKTTPGVRQVRNVNEHGFDVSGNEESKPSMHHHELESLGSAAVDETSMIISGPEKILMGPLNLFDVYRAVARMRDLAGFASLARSG